MALVVKDRVRETSTSTGTGTIILNGAVAGFQSFAAVGDGNTTYYTIVDAVTEEWEVGIGTYTASGTTLSRDTVLESSNGGTAINFAANIKDVFVTYPAERSVYVDGSTITPASGALLPVVYGGTGAATLTGYVKGSGTSALTASPTIPSTDITGLGTMSVQNANNVAITGGSINGTTVGASTPSTGAFTNLSYTGTLTGGTGVINIGSGQIYKDASGRLGVGLSSINAGFIAQFNGSIGLGSPTRNQAITASIGIRTSDDPVDNSRSNVVFGTTTGASSSNSFIAFNTNQYGVSGGERMRIDSSGNVGIGTGLPSFPNGGGLVVYNSFIPRIDLKNSITGDLSTDGAGMAMVGSDYILYNKEATGPIGFYTAGSERMRIDSSGNVGIGTSSPAAKFAVSTGDPTKQFVVDLSGDPVVKIGLPEWYNVGALAFVNGTGAGEVMRITSSGNVGIGTSSPAVRLHAATTDNVTVARFTGASYAVRVQSITGVGALLEGTNNTEGTYQPLLVGGSVLQLTTSGSERARIDSSGNLLVGTTGPFLAGRLCSTHSEIGASFQTTASVGAFTAIAATRNGNNGNVAQWYYNPSTFVGSVSVTSTATSYNTSSDYRLKTDIKPMTNAIERLMQLEPVNYAWIADGSRADGLIAHKAQEVVPQAVTGKKDEVDKDGNPVYQGVDYSKLVPLVSAALQEAVKRIEQLEAQLNSGV